MMSLRPTGIDTIGDAPWGTHFCQFYGSKQDLVDILVPYFKAGLESDEHCMWVTSAPLGVQEAWEALGRALPDLSAYRERGRIEILPHTDWYLAGGRFDQDRVLQGWVGRLEDALSRGCAGLRLSGNTFWLEKRDWRSFTAYEEAIDSVLGQYRMLALCTYSLERCSAAEVADVIRNHEFALLKRDGRWERIESYHRRRMQEAQAREQERSRQTLRETEERHRLLVETMLQGVVHQDSEGRIISMNSAAERILGRTPEEFLGSSSVEEQDRTIREDGSPFPGMEHPAMVALRTGQPLRDVVMGVLNPRENAYRWISIDAVPLFHPGAEKPHEVYTVFADITDRRRSEERYRRTLDSMIEGCAILSPDWTYLYVNKVNAQHAHSRPEELLSRNLLELFPGVESSPFFEAYRRCMEERTPQEVEAEFTFADGSTAWYEVRAMPVPEGIFVLSHDITERKQMEREKERYLGQIQEANEAKDLFFNTLSHELRTPLAAMLNSIEVVKKPDVVKSQRARAFGILERNIRQQARLIDDLLDLSRIMRKKIEIDREPLDLREVVSAQVEAIEPAAQKAQLSLRIEAPVEPVPIVGDAVRLGQVVSNLLANAVKFTGPGGWVKVRVAPEHGEAVVRVADSGIGIAPEDLPRIFEVFRQAGSSPTRVKGLGIGLTVARSLAELHGGRLDAQSGGVGKGSEFTFRLPRRTARASEENAPARRLEPAPQSRRILVIEDNADLRESLLLLLEILGHTAVAASEGGAGVELARRERPDVALVDIGLPDMDGYAVARVLRGDGALRDTRLIALSGYATPEHRERALAAGFDRHLAKPVDADELQRAITGDA